jgi:hypothetical protein
MCVPCLIKCLALHLNCAAALAILELYGKDRKTDKCECLVREAAHDETVSYR